MRVPTAEELAAIAAAYLSMSRAAAAAQPAAVPSRWRFASRLPVADAPPARILARAASRWTIAGRLDD